MTSIEVARGSGSGSLRNRALTTRIDAVQITELPPTPFKLPGGGVVHIPTQRWALERWMGEADPLDLARTWARKPKFSVGGRRSCAELAIVAYLQTRGWEGVWVSAFGRQELRRDWFPAAAFKTLVDHAPDSVVETFDRLRAANGGRLGGFFDVFAWNEDGEVRFAEAKVGKDRIRPTQLRFVETALHLHHPLEEFTIIEVPATLRPAARLPVVGGLDQDGVDHELTRWGSDHR